MSTLMLQKLSLEPGSDNDGHKTVLLRELGSTEENWTKAVAQGTGIVVFGFALNRIVDTRLISLAAGEVGEQHAIFRAQVVVTEKDKLAFQIDTSDEPIVVVKPWPVISPSSTDFPGFLILPGDSHSEGYVSSQTLNMIVRTELNTSFTSHKGSSQRGAKSGIHVLELHVYYHHSEPKTVIVIRVHGGALDRPSAVQLISSFLATLNAVVDGGETPASAAFQRLEARDGAQVLPPIEELMPKQFLAKSILKTASMIGKAFSCSTLPFREGFPDHANRTLYTELLSFTLGKPGTAALLAAVEREKTTYSATLAAAFLKSSAKLWKEKKGKRSSPEFSFTCLQDCRDLFPKPLPASAVGVYSAGIAIEKKVEENEALWELARNISSAYNKELLKAKHFTHLATMNSLFSQVLKHPSMTPSSSLRTSAFSLFTEPLHSNWKHTENLNLVGTYGPFSSMHGPGPCFCVGENMLDGPELCLTLVYPEPVHSRQQMEAIASAAIDLLLSEGS